VNLTYLAAILGFAFVWIWIRIDFGSAILCLLGAIIFAFVASLVRGDVRIEELQERFGRRRTP
jgi:hypothetical protein